MTRWERVMMGGDNIPGSQCRIQFFDVVNELVAGPWSQGSESLREDALVLLHELDAAGVVYELSDAQSVALAGGGVPPKG